MHSQSMVDSVNNHKDIYNNGCPHLSKLFSRQWEQMCASSAARSGADDDNTSRMCLCGLTLAMEHTLLSHMHKLDINEMVNLSSALLWYTR